MDRSNVVFSYTRADAIEDGTFFDLMEDGELGSLVREAGFVVAGRVVPFCCTQALLAECIEVNERSKAGEDRVGRFWDILNVLRATLPRDFKGPDEHWFKVIVSGQIQELLADFTFDDEGRPAVTLCFAHER